MSLESNSLLHTAKELLAASLMELFPGTELIQGEVACSSFYYDFCLPAGRVVSFGEKEMQRLEEHMRMLAFEKRPIMESEMMRENAQIFLESMGQRRRAEEVGILKEVLVPLFRMGSFCDICPAPYLPDSSHVKFFKLVEASFEAPFLRLYGIAADSKEGLKGAQQAFKEAKMRDPELLGPEMGLFARNASNQIIFLPKGEALRQSLIDQWKEMFTQMGFQFVHAPFPANLKEVHRLVFEKEKSSRPFHVATFREDGDVASTFYKEEAVLDEIISSLHFIEQTIKIFQLERQLVFVRPKRGREKEIALLEKGLKSLGVPYGEESFSHEVAVEFRLVDGWGRHSLGPFVTLDAAAGVIHRSLFGPLESWILHLIERKR